jgi:hypothetical protein
MPSFPADLVVGLLNQVSAACQLRSGMERAQRVHEQLHAEQRQEVRWRQGRRGRALHYQSILQSILYAIL